MTRDELFAFAENAWTYGWIRALAVLLGTIVVAKIAEFVITRVIARLTHFTDTDLDDKLIALLRRPIFITLVAIGFFTAINVAGLDPAAARVLRSLVSTVLIVVWLFSGGKIISTLLDGLSRLADRVTWIESRTLPLFDNLAKLLIFGAAVYMLLVAWNLDKAPWLASAGVAGLAISFAAKDSIANLFGGFFVIMDSPYKIGDYINLDSGERGQVIKIGLRSTRLLTRDDVEVTVPNGAIANAKVVNESGGPYEKRRVVVRVGVVYGSNVDQVTELLIRSAEKVDLISTDPAPRIRFTEMGDSALIFRVLGWIEKPELRGQAVHYLNREIYNDLAAAGIVIPFPQRVVHLAGGSADEPSRPDAV